MKKLLLPLLGLLAGLGISCLVTPRYVSKATLVMTDPQQGSPSNYHKNAFKFLMACKSEVMSRGSLASLIQARDLNLYPDKRSRMPLDDVIEMTRKSITLDIVDRPFFPSDRTTAFRISFPYSDPVKAQAANRKIVDRFREVHQAKSDVARGEFGGIPEPVRVRILQLENRVLELEKELRKKLGPEPPQAPARPRGPEYSLAQSSDFFTTMQVLDEPTLPVTPDFPNRFMFAGTGFCAGLISMPLFSLLNRPKRNA